MRSASEIITSLFMLSQDYAAHPPLEQFDPLQNNLRQREPYTAFCARATILRRVYEELIIVDLQVHPSELVSV